MDVAEPGGVQGTAQVLRIGGGQAAGGHHLDPALVERIDATRQPASPAHWRATGVTFAPATVSRVIGDG